MFGFASVLILLLISLVSSAFVAPRDECYNITTSTGYAPSSLSKKTYTFPNITAAQQCQVSITSWLTTTVTLTSSSGDASSNSASNATTSHASNNAPPAIKRSALSTTAPTSMAASPTSNMSSTTSTINANSILSEFASIYSVLTQYEYNLTANTSTATAGNSYNVSAFSTSIGSGYSNYSTANATSNPTTCVSSCTACTTVFYIATTTITTTTPPPSPIADLPPITVGTNTYTATSGSYYVIDNSTLSPGGYAILVSNSTLLSLSPSGTQLVIAPLSPTAGGPGPSTYDLSPAPASSPPLTNPTSTTTSTSTSAVSQAAEVVKAASATITGPYNLPVVVLPNNPIVIAGTTLTPGSSGVTIRETPVSLAPSSAFLVVGSSTITLAMTTIKGVASATPTTTSTTTTQAKVGGMIWSGIGGTEPGSSATSTTTTTSSAATVTGNNATYIGQVFTGAGSSSRGKVGICFWSGLGLVFGIPIAGVLL